MNYTSFNRALFILVLFSLSLSLSSQIIDKREINHPWKTDFSQQEVELNEFMALLPPDGIPPIDEPSFTSIDKALSEYLLDKEPVIVVGNGKEGKAYPLSILMYHEVVNDSISDFLFTVTYCPLCNAALVFNRNLTANGKDYKLDFGVSGMLRGSDMVMWDRQTESWWQQIMGRGLVGELAGVDLEIIPSQIMSAEQFAKKFPKGLCLKRPEENEQYGNNPYVGYDGEENESPRLFFGEIDSRLRPTERVVAIHSDDNSKAYPLSILKSQKVINDNPDDKALVIFHAEGQLSVMDKANIGESKDIGTVAVYSAIVNGEELSFRWEDGKYIDQQSQSRWNIHGECVKGKMKGAQLDKVPYGIHFAFAWFHFYPRSDIHVLEK